MIVNPVKLTIARHELETLLEAAQFRQKRLASSQWGRSLLEMAIDTIEDVLAREDQRRSDPKPTGIWPDWGDSPRGFDGPGGAE